MQLQLPTREDFDSLVADRYTWRAMDSALYYLCRMKPTGQIDRDDIIHSSVESVAKIYGALIQRDWAMGVIGDSLTQLAVTGELQRKLDQLPVEPSPTEEAMARSIEIHGWFCDFLHGKLGTPAATDRNHRPFRPRSFVAKWLHFHRPGVPIYDSRADTALAKMKISRTPLPVDGEQAVDEEYRAFCERLWTFSQSLGPPTPSVRDLDIYLYLKGNTA